MGSSPAASISSSTAPPQAFPSFRPASCARSPSSTSAISPSLPDVQFLGVAAGMPQIPEMSSWIGLVAPAGTPPEIVAKIHDGVVKAYADPAVAEKLDRAGINAVTTTPAEFDKFVRDETAHWTKVFKESGVKFD